MGALREREIRSILLKGPVTAGWLYADAQQRDYGDIDLLVAPEDFAAAEAVLAGLGYACGWPAMRVDEAPGHERPWTRGEPLPAEVDLHRSFFGATVDPGVVWAAVSETTESIEICGERVEALGLVARTFQLAVHAAQHGVVWQRSVTDIELGIGRIDEPVWAAAAGLADRLGASESFASGLRLTGAGRLLAERLGLGEPASAELSLRAGGAPVTALGFARLRAQTSPGGRVRFLVSKLFPSPSLIRFWLPLARRGRLGLALGYAYRPVWLVWRAPRGWAAWRRAAREAAVRRAAPEADS